MIKIAECGCCGQFHLVGHTGDCRDDAARFTYQDLLDKFGEEGIDWYIALVPPGKYDEDWDTTPFTSDRERFGGNL